MKTVKTSKGTELPLISLKGKDYLQVAHRLVWFREERPNWSLETDFLTLTDSHAIAKAIVKDEQGRIIATAHKREDKGHFADFLEKAETSAIGRALALVGYGTQFAEELDEESRIVDSPVAPKTVVQKQTIVSQAAPKAVTPTKPEQEVIASTIDQALKNMGTGPLGAPFDLKIRNGIHAGKQIQELSLPEAEEYFASIDGELKALNRPAATLRGASKDLYYTLAQYIEIRKGNA